MSSKLTADVGEFTTLISNGNPNTGDEVAVGSTTPTGVEEIWIDPNSSDVTTADIPDSTDKRYVTDTEKTNIGTITGKANLSGGNSFTGTQNFSNVIQQISGQFSYLCASLTADTVNDRRVSNIAGVLTYEICTVLGATKGGGTWVVVNSFDTNGFELVQYDDIQPSAAFVPAAGGTAPDVTAHTIGGVSMNFYSFDGNATEETMTGVFEVLHGVDVDGLNRVSAPLVAEIHTHGMASTTGSGVVKIFFDLVYIPVNSAPIAWGTVSTLITISANQQYYHKISGVELTKPSSGYSIGDMAIVKYRRTPTDAEDTYAGDWLFKQCAFHFPFNSNGSRQRYTK